jgi:hypothetical protein
VEVLAEWTDGALRRYLLGLLPEEEAEALEDAYLAHPEVFERLRGVEEDLLDDYAAGRLAPADTTAIESRYRASSPLRERLHTARALRRAIDAGRPHPTSRVIATPAARWIVPLALAASLILVAVVYWPGRPPRSVVSSIPSPSATARSESPAPSTGDAQPPVIAPSTATTHRPAAAPLVLALSPGLLRGQQRPVPVVPAGTEEVIFELEGDPAILPPPPSALAIVVETLEGRSIWRGEARRPAKTARPSLLASARVPTSRLGPGDYLLTLYSGPAEGAPLHRYYFRLGR